MLKKIVPVISAIILIFSLTVGAYALPDDPLDTDEIPLDTPSAETDPPEETDEPLDTPETTTTTEEQLETDPPETDPPVTAPPVTNPTAPTATEPPVTLPPTTLPPSVTTTTTTATTTTTTTTSHTTTRLPTVPGEEVTTGTTSGSTTTTPATTTEETTDNVSLTLNVRDRVMHAGDTYQVVATLTGSVADPSLRYYSYNMNVATFGQDGVITAHAPGSTMLVVVNDYTGIYATLDVTVLAADEVATEIITDNDNINLILGKTDYINAKVFPSDSDQTLHYSSSDPFIAAVDAEGKVLGISEGTAIITVSTPDGAYSRDITVTVISEELIQNISFEGYLYDRSGSALEGVKLTLENGDSTSTGKNGYFIFGSHAATACTLSLEQSGKSYSTTFHPEQGDTLYFVLRDDGLISSAEYDAVVKEFDITSVKFSQTTIQMIIGETYQLKYTYAPEKSTVRTLELLSSNPSIAVVTPDGNVSANKIGSCEVTLRLNGGDKTAVCRIEVLAGESTEHSMLIIILISLLIIAIAAVFFVLYRKYLEQLKKDEES